MEKKNNRQAICPNLWQLFMLSSYIKKFNQAGEIYLRVKARPDAGVSIVKQILKNQDGDIVKIDIAAPAVKGRANLELIKFLAQEFAISKNNIKIIGGAGERFKLVKIIK